MSLFLSHEFEHRSGPEGRVALGPRYIELRVMKESSSHRNHASLTLWHHLAMYTVRFHPTLPFAYVVNELSSEAPQVLYVLGSAGLCLRLR